MKPFELHFELEPGCVLACRHCSSSAMSRQTRAYENEDIVRLMQALGKPVEAYFTGGEPLLYADLPDLFASVGAAVADCRFGLFTTGIVSAAQELTAVSFEYLSELHEKGLGVCYVSMYSDAPAWHDFMTGREDSFETTCLAITRMVSAGIDTRINLVLTKFNYADIPGIISFASGLGVTEIRLLKLIRHGRAAENWTEIGLSEAEYAETIRRLIASQNDFSVRLTFSGMPDVVPCRPVPGAAGCQAGSNLLYVGLDGSVYPCACVKNDPASSVFNIRDRELEKRVREHEDTEASFRCLSERAAHKRAKRTKEAAERGA